MYQVLSYRRKLELWNWPEHSLCLGSIVPSCEKATAWQRNLGLLHLSVKSHHFRATHLKCFSNEPWKVTATFTDGLLRACGESYIPYFPNNPFTNSSLDTEFHCWGPCSHPSLLFGFSPFRIGFLHGCFRDLVCKASLQSLRLSLFMLTHHPLKQNKKLSSTWPHVAGRWEIS